MDIYRYCDNGGGGACAIWGSDPIRISETSMIYIFQASTWAKSLGRNSNSAINLPAIGLNICKILLALFRIIRAYKTFLTMFWKKILMNFSMLI